MIPSKKRRRALAHLARMHADSTACEKRPARNPNLSKKAAVEERSRKVPGYSTRSVVSKNIRSGSPENRSMIGRHLSPKSGGSRVPRGKSVKVAVSGTCVVTRIQLPNRTNYTEYDTDIVPTPKFREHIKM